MQTLILDHYPPVIKQIKEIQQIAKAEDMEFSNLKASAKAVESNMFVTTADESGVRRFEKLLGIKPKAAQGLDDRRMHILSAMNRRKMSLLELSRITLNGHEGIRLKKDIASEKITVEMTASTVNINTLNNMLEEILPLNICISFAIKTEPAQPAVRALARMGATLKIKPRLADGVQIKGISVAKADLRALGVMKVKAYAEKAFED